MSRIAPKFVDLDPGSLVYGDASGKGTDLPIGSAGYVLTSSGGLPTWLPAPGTTSAFFASSQVITNSSPVSSAAFTTFSNSPAFTFTPTVTGTYKVYANAAVNNNNNAAQCNVRIFNTSGGATLLKENTVNVYSSFGNVFASTQVLSVFTLTAGVSYVFDIQGYCNGGALYLDGSLASFYMFAELIVSGTSTSPSMRYYSSSTSISGTLATVVYATSDYDTNSAYSSGTYTIPEIGKYQVNASLLIAGTISLNDTLIIEIQKNGTVVSRRTKYLLAGMTDGDIQISDIINCAATDTIRIQVSTSAITPTIVSSNFDNYLSISKLP